MIQLTRKDGKCCLTGLAQTVVRNLEMHHHQPGGLSRYPDITVDLHFLLRLSPKKWSMNPFSFASSEALDIPLSIRM